ncbi:hypothetical protein JB92DRAFT_3248894 [Gautieria morchelliformis]|nr:hypothetical protein JB92DRAFT_3248894 [Gautieria morchelliformis]
MLTAMFVGVHKSNVTWSCGPRRRERQFVCICRYPNPSPVWGNSMTKYTAVGNHASDSNFPNGTTLAIEVGPSKFLGGPQNKADEVYYYKYYTRPQKRRVDPAGKRSSWGDVVWPPSQAPQPKDRDRRSRSSEAAKPTLSINGQKRLLRSSNPTIFLFAGLGSALRTGELCKDRYPEVNLPVPGCVRDSDDGIQRTFTVLTFRDRHRQTPTIRAGRHYEAVDGIGGSGRGTYEPRESRTDSIDGRKQTLSLIGVRRAYTLWWWMCVGRVEKRVIRDQDARDGAIMSYQWSTSLVRKSFPPKTAPYKYTRIASMHTLTAQVPVARNVSEDIGTRRPRHSGSNLEIPLESKVLALSLLVLVRPATSSLNRPADPGTQSLGEAPPYQTVGQRSGRRAR